jgi:hypothetical protein
MGTMGISSWLRARSRSIACRVRTWELAGCSSSRTGFAFGAPVEEWKRRCGPARLAASCFSVMGTEMGPLLFQEIARGEAGSAPWAGQVFGRKGSYFVGEGVIRGHEVRGRSNGAKNLLRISDTIRVAFLLSEMSGHEAARRRQDLNREKRSRI